MDAKIVLLIVSIPGFHCLACGEPPVCQCFEPLGLISCQDIHEFPIFKESDVWKVDMLDIVRSNLSKLPNLEDWKNLRMVTLQEIKFMDCNALKEERFYILSDCSNDSLYNAKEIEHSLLWPYFLSVIPFSILGLVGGYKMMYQNFRKWKVEGFPDEEAESSSL